MTQLNHISGTATTISTREGTTFVTYHSTDVVSFNREEIILNTGGWFTATTKTRMNQASNQFDLGYRVFQDKGRWFVDFLGSCIKFNEDKITLQR